MGVSKVEFGGKTLVDLTGDTVNPQSLLKGETAHGADGEPVEGAMVAVPTTASLAVTQEGVSALDGTVGKVLNDKVENLTWRSYEGTLPAGSTTITIPIGSYNENSSAYFQTDIYGTALLNVEFKTEESGNSCVLTFEAQSKDMRVVVNIK